MYLMVLVNFSNKNEITLHVCHFTLLFLRVWFEEESNHIISIYHIYNFILRFCNKFILQLKAQNYCELVNFLNENETSYICLLHHINLYTSVIQKKSNHVIFIYYTHIVFQ